MLTLHTLAIWFEEFSSGGYKIIKICIRINIPKGNPSFYLSALGF
jgi:hypothetical protein